MAELQDLFPDEVTTNEGDVLDDNATVEDVADDDGLDVPDNGTEEPDLSTDGDDVISELKKKLEKIEEEKRMLQSKKDREIAELQKRLEAMEKKFSGESDEVNSPFTETLNEQEIVDLLYENPVEAIDKVVSAKFEKYLEERLPKIQAKIEQTKKQKVVETWEKDLQVAADFIGEDVINNLEHPFTKAMAEFISKNSQSYAASFNPNLIRDAYKYAKKKIGVKRSGDGVASKKASSVVSTKSKKKTATSPNKKPANINDLFDAPDW